MPRHDELENEDDRVRPRRRAWDDDRPPRRRDEGDRPSGGPAKKGNAGLVVALVVVAVLIICGGGGALVYWFVSSVKNEIAQAQIDFEAAIAEGDAAMAAENLTQIGQAIRAYEAAQGALPNNSYDDEGRPLLSWRVHLLPYLREADLYRKFHLNEPWDSANNRPLLDQMPPEFVLDDPETAIGMTHYRGFSHQGAIFERPFGKGPPPRITLVDGIPDGPANTVLVVEASQPVEWTRPDDLDWPARKDRPRLGGVNPKRPYFLAVTADGTVRRIRRDVTDDTLRLLIDRKDGKTIPPGWEYPVPGQ